jgi:hypothetical protein
MDHWVHGESSWNIRGDVVERGLKLLVSERGAGAERIESITGYLRRELDQLDEVHVTGLPAGEAPEGSRGSEVMAIGGLLVTLGNSAQALGRVIGVVRDRLARSPGRARTVRLELGGDVLELSQACAAEPRRLIDLFVGRHSAVGRSP